MRAYKFVVAESLRYSVKNGIRQGVSEVYNVVGHEVAQHCRQKQRTIPEYERDQTDEQILPGVEQYKKIPSVAFDKRVEQIEHVVGVDEHACGYRNGNGERIVRALPHADPYDYRDSGVPDRSQTLTSLVMAAAC